MVSGLDNMSVQFMGRRWWIFFLDGYNFVCKEAHEIFRLDIKPSDSIIEIGSAPGGISYYLLELGVKLTSIDPAVMDPHLLEQYAKNFTHLKESIFDIQSQHLPSYCDWVISDLNLDGDLNINQSGKIIKMFPNLKGAFLTVKTPRSEDIKRISKWTIGFKQRFKVNIINLPSHRKEIGIILQRK